MAETPTIVPGYTLHDGAPDVPTYRSLRQLSGLSPKTAQQATGALAGSWDICHVVHEESNAIVAMGRTFGDGGWYFVIADMAVLPQHQRKGLGALVLARLMRKIEKEVPGAYVNLNADVPGRPLYEKFGFRETAPSSVAMLKIL